MLGLVFSLCSWAVIQHGACPVGVRSHRIEAQICRQLGPFDWTQVVSYIRAGSQEKKDQK